MAVYSRQVENVLRQIKAKGQSVKWVCRAEGVIVNSDKPWELSQGVDVEKDATIAFFPTSRVGLEFQTRVKESEVRQGSIVGYMGAVNFEPNVKDYVNRNGVILNIEYIDVLSPNGEIILYTIGFKQ